MNNFQSLNHTRWIASSMWCGYRVQEEGTTRELRKQLAPVLKELANQKESEVLEGRLVEDHVHMLISIPPKYAVAQVIGYIKGKSAIWIARTCGREKTPSARFLRQGYVTTAGLVKKRSATTSESRKTRIRVRSAQDVRRVGLPLGSSRRLTALSGSHIFKPPALPGDE